MIDWEIWKMLEELVIELGLLICVNSGTLHNSPLHRNGEASSSGFSGFVLRTSFGCSRTVLIRGRG